MKMTMKTILSVMLSLFLVFSFASCQSSEVAEEAVEIVTAAPEEDSATADIPPAPADPVEAEAPAEEEAPAAPAVEVPVSMSVGYRGYEMDIESYDGYAEITYPEGIVTDDDVVTFLSAEAEKYGDSISGVSYSFADGVITLEYPEGVPAADRRALSTMFVTDVIETVGSLYPATGADPVSLVYRYGD